MGGGHGIFHGNEAPVMHQGEREVPLATHAEKGLCRRDGCGEEWVLEGLRKIHLKGLGSKFRTG